MSIMKTLFVLLAFSDIASAQTNTLGLESLPASGTTWTGFDVFSAGMICGAVINLSGFILRIVRQVARQNPEI